MAAMKIQARSNDASRLKTVRKSNLILSSLKFSRRTKILCWKGQDKQTGIQTRIQTHV